MTEIHDRIAALEAQLAELKAEVTPEVEVVSSRRDMFKKLAIGAAGVAVGGAALAKATPAPAADGDAVTVGQTKTGSVVTGLAGTGLFLFGGTANVQIASENNRRPQLYASDTSIFFGPNANQIGVYADMTGDNSQGLHAHGKTIGARIESAQGATLILGNSTIAVPPTSGAWEQGTVLRKDGELWMCTEAGTPGAWTRMTASPLSAGELFLLDAPVRVYDSRPAANGPAATGDGPLGAGAERAVSLASGYVGATATPAVPAGATAALVTLTVADTTGAGFLGLFSNALATWPGTSNINWSAAGQAIATTTVSGVDADAKVRLHAGGSITGTNFILDVIGFYG